MSGEGTERARRPLLLGHRGCRGVVPENTFEAFDKALADGCDGFEFDVRRTADARNVICHDAKLDGLDIGATSFEALNARWMHRPSFRKRSNIPALAELGRGTHEQIAPVGLPCFDEVVARYAGRAFLDIELKTIGLEEATVDLLRTSDMARVVVSSFLPEVVDRVHRLDERIPTGYIFDSRRAMGIWEGLAVSHIMPHHRLVTAALIEEWHRAGKKVIAWTVNDTREMERFAEWGVDGLISDDTELLSRTFSGMR